MNPHDPEFIERFAADATALNARGPLMWEVSVADAMIIVGQIQVSLRHPQNSGSVAQRARELIDQMIEHLGQTETLKAGLLAGNDRRWDVPAPQAYGPAVVRPQVVTLCGSTRFKQEFIDANQRETMWGRIVLSRGLFGHADGVVLSEEEKRMLDELHLRKIDQSDHILVLNAMRLRCAVCKRWQEPGELIVHRYDCTSNTFEHVPYIGTSTRREIIYAREHQKVVRWLNLPDEFALPSEGN